MPSSNTASQEASSYATSYLPLPRIPGYHTVISLTLNRYGIAFVPFEALLWLYSVLSEYQYFFLFFFFFFGLFRAASMAYGSSQARGGIGATAANLRHSHSNAISEPCL